MALINKQNQNGNTLKFSVTDSFPLILTTEILKYCKDYKILKTIQSTSSTINNLFTCPRQSIWKQLCHLNRYKCVLKKESGCILKRNRSIWETIYYQNWIVDMNWNNKMFETIRLASTNNRLVKMVNGGTVLGLSFSLDSKEVSASILDFKNGGLMIRSMKISGQVTSSCLLRGLLILGKSCGSMTIFRLSENTEITVKFHSKEITSIILFESFIVSGDIGGQIIKSKADIATTIAPIILYQSDSGVTALNQNGKEIFAATVNGILIKISFRNNDKIFIEKFNFSEFGSINCIASADDLLILGTDTGKLNVLNRRTSQQTIKLLTNSPITSIATDSKRIISGHFDGTVSIYTIETENMFIEHFGDKAPVWSVGIDEISFLSSSLNGTVLLRRLL